jgi:uncharacterized membrane protein
MAESPVTKRAAPGHTPERVVFFTDAVFAIAMTLLVIEIPRPEASDFDPGDGVSKTEAVSRLWHFIAHQGSSFFAYVLAFYILWIVWREHHRLFDQVSEMSRAMIGLHFPLLLLAAFLPYPTTVIGHYASNPVAAFGFTLAVGGLLLCRTLIHMRALRDNVLLPDVDRQKFQAEVTVSFIVTAYWLATLVLAWWAPWVLIAWTLTSLVAEIARRTVTRRAEAHKQQAP